VWLTIFTSSKVSIITLSAEAANILIEK